MGYIFEKRNRCVERRNEIFDQGFNWEVNLYVGDPKTMGHYYFDNEEEAQAFKEKMLIELDKLGYPESYLRYYPAYRTHMKTNAEIHAIRMANEPDYAAKFQRKQERLAWDAEHPIEAAQRMLKHNQKLLDKAEKDLKETLTELKRRQNRIAKLQQEIEKNLAIIAGKTA